jgi:hypothetical protein
MRKEELIAKLEKLPPGSEVFVWLEGDYSELNIHEVPQGNDNPKGYCL